MARIRSIKPELRTSITVSQWPREVRYFFVLMLGYLDDYGRGVDDELLIASDCFPRDRDVTPERVDAWLELIADSGPLCRYEVDGRQYLHAPNWHEHQKPSHPTRSKVPPCPDDEPDDFKRWRETHPQRLRNRSRKSREGFEKFPGALSGTSDTPSGASPKAAPDPSSRVVDTSDGVRVTGGLWGDESADQSQGDDAPESLANSSGDVPENFVPELGSKGAREQGSGGARERGVQGGTDPRGTKPNAPTEASRSDDRGSLHELPDDFDLTDAMRKWANQTYPRVNVDHETQKFIWHWREERKRRRNWYVAWQRWIADANEYLNRHGQPAPAAVGGNVLAFRNQDRPLTGTDAKVAAHAALTEQIRAMEARETS